MFRAWYGHGATAQGHKGAGLGRAGEMVGWLAGAVGFSDLGV